jgi:hypothetical protein
MSESSAEEAKGQEAPKAEAEKAKVPVEVVGKLRAEKRTALQEVEQLKQKLAQQQEQQGQPFDMDAFLGTLSPLLTEIAQKAAAEAVAPVKAEADKFKTAVELGLNKDQADAIAKYREAHPTLTAEQAFKMAKDELPKLFPPVRSGMQPPRLPSGLPPGGDSEIRNAPKQEDLVAKANELRRNKDVAGAKDVAEQELKNRLIATFRLPVRPA